MVDFLGRFKKPKRVGGDGELTVFCASEQDGISIDLARWQMLATDVLKAEGVRGARQALPMFWPFPSMRSSLSLLVARVLYREAQIGPLRILRIRLYCSAM